jgi:hypothetical protein
MKLLKRISKLFPKINEQLKSFDSASTSQSVVPESRLFLIDLDNIAGGESSAAQLMRAQFEEMVQTLINEFYPRSTVEVRVYGNLAKNKVAESPLYRLIDTPCVTREGKTLADSHLLWDISQAYYDKRPITVLSNDCDFSVHLQKVSESGHEIHLFTNSICKSALRYSSAWHKDIRWLMVRELNIPAEEMARRDLTGLVQRHQALEIHWVKKLLRIYLLKGWSNEVSEYDLMRLLRRALPEYQLAVNDQLLSLQRR